MESRVLSLKADQDALAEKLRISEEYADNLQNKMEELYVIRDACSQRYKKIIILFTYRLIYKCNFNILYERKTAAAFFSDMKIKPILINYVSDYNNLD